MAGKVAPSPACEWSRAIPSQSARFFNLSPTDFTTILGSPKTLAHIPDISHGPGRSTRRVDFRAGVPMRPEAPQRLVDYGFS